MTMTAWGIKGSGVRKLQLFLRMPRASSTSADPWQLLRSSTVYQIDQG